MATESSRLDNFIVLKKLGKGATATVKSVQDPNTLQIYAAKILRNQGEHLTARFRELMQNEIQNLARITHPNIVNIINANENGIYVRKNGKGTYNCMYIVMELCPNGELFDILFKTGRLSEEVSRFYFKQIIQGLSACHNSGIAHRDMKPENLLFDSEFNLKIADFGFSTLLVGRDGTGLMHTRLGTESYMAPEFHMRVPYTGESVDLFAAGIILFIMYSQNPPFSKADPSEAYYKALSSGHENFWAMHSRGKPLGHYSADFKDLIKRLLALKPSDRLSVEQIENHIWYKGRTATPQDIIIEIDNRRRRVVEAAERGKAQRRPNQGVGVNGGRYYRGDPTESEGLTLSFEVPRKEFNVKVLPNQGLINKYCSLVTGLTPNEITTILSNEFGKLDAQCETIDNSYDTKVKVTTEIGTVMFKSSIYKTPDDYYVIDFSYIEGSHIEMMKVFTEISEIMLNVQEEVDY